MLETRTLKGKEVTLPGYMNTLSQEDIDLISNESSVISCGVENQILYILTFNLDVRRIKPNGKLRPKFSQPARDGMCLVTYFEGFEDPSLILSSVAIENSESCLLNTTLHVNDNYMCDLEIVDIDYENNTETSERTNK